MRRWFFQMTIWPEAARSADHLLSHYRIRVTFEDRLCEFNESIGVHLSMQELNENEGTRLLAMLAFNLNTIYRKELEAAAGGCWKMRRFVECVMKVGGRLLKHSRRWVMRIVQSAEPLRSRLTGRLEARQATPAKAHATSGFMPPPAHAHLGGMLRC